jgi:hypothetical protein
MLGKLRTPAVLLLVGVLLLSLVAPGGAGEQQAEVTRRRIGPGAFYKKIVKPWKKWVIHVVTVDLERDSTIDVALAGNELGYVEPLSAIASRKGAIAAINGDFGSHERRPWNTYAEDGDFVQTEITWGRALSVNTPEDEAFIGHPRPQIMLVPNGKQPLRIRRVNNGKPQGSEVALFTGSAKDVEDTPQGTCSVRLLRTSARTINDDGAATQRFEVSANRCATRPLPIYKGIVASVRRSAKTKEAIKALSVGTKAKLVWKLGGIDETLDVIGGNPMIVENGKVLWNVVTDCGYLCRLHPRSAVGIAKDKLIMAVVDGRSETARGMYLHELARWFVAQGAERVMTFDGGGAAEMWVRGEVVNAPSDGRERPVVNALLLLPRGDAGDPAPAVAGSSFGSAVAPVMTASDAVAEQAFEDSAADAGSLGGLADFLERRGADLPPWMEEIAADLRANAER